MEIQRFEKNAQLSKIISAIESDGAVIVENILEPTEIKQLQEECAKCLAKTVLCKGHFYGKKTKRFSNMIKQSVACQNMALNEIILGVMDYFLLPSCDKYQLNLSQMISIGPEENEQLIHADDPMFRFPHRVTSESLIRDNIQVMINVMWAVDDFTAENGATNVFVGSHLWPRKKVDQLMQAYINGEPINEEAMQAEMKAGSYLIYLGSTVHGGGANKTLKQRTGITLSYNLGWLKQAENYFLTIPLKEVKTFPSRLQELIGYFVHRPNLHKVCGRDPSELLDADIPDLERRGFEDKMPENVEEILRENYERQNREKTTE